MNARHQDELRQIRRRMQHILAQIGQSYDFRKFTLEGLVNWLENRRGREILFVPWAMHTAVFGAWIATEDSDYVFYAANALPLHQLHIKLHELAHMLCGHKTVTVTNDAVYHLWIQSLQDEAPAAASLLMRSMHEEEKEREAEILSSLIQEQAFRNDQWRVLTNALMTNQDLERFYQAVGLVP